jgi:uncharacterized alkaline shock family protein YloU
MPDGVGDLADDIAALVCAVPGVTGLHPGMFGEVATYLPRRRVSGVRVTEYGVDVHVVVAAGAPLRSTAAAVRAAVAATLPGRTVDVTVEDIDASEPLPSTPIKGST